MQVAQTIRISIITLSLLTALVFSIITGVYAKKLEKCRSIAASREKTITELSKSLASTREFSQNMALSYEEQLLNYQEARAILKDSKPQKISELEVIDEKASRDVCAYCNELFGL